MGTSSSNVYGRRLGVLGGSFDPPHLGHLVIASQAHHQLRLDAVLMVPAWSPPHKPEEQLSPAATRLEMATAAAAGDARLEVSDIELARALRYSVETVEAVHEAYAPMELWFLIGADSLLALDTWKDPQHLVSCCRLAVAPRPGHRSASVAAAADRYGGATLLAAPALDISSTDIRHRVRRGVPITYLVPRSVERIIERSGLYREVG